MRSVQFKSLGGPAVLELIESSLPTPGPKQLLVRTAFAGVNMIDTYMRKGIYAVESLPSGLGKEFAGVVEQCGAECSSLFRVGQRVASASVSASYSTHVLVDESVTVPVPDGVSLELAAASLLKGLTARFLVKQTFQVGPTTTALVYAAAGGTGQLLCQWIKALGGKVIAVTSTKSKAELATLLGADSVIVSSEEDIAKRVFEITDGVGVDVAYDSVGKDTFEFTLEALKIRGLFVSYGNASGPVPEFAPLRLAKKSLYLTRPVLFHHIPTHQALLAAAQDFFDTVLSGAVKVAPPSVLKLEEAGKAHELLESRKTTGSLVLDTK
jgi:NADPH:quinone reductase